MALTAPQGPDKKRVKVYELKNNDWYDRGTGFCSGLLVNDEAKIHVQSEDEPGRMLLETKISRDDGYQKQQETLIVWTDQNVTDMALSFQEAEGCSAIWDFVNESQQRLGLGDDTMSDDMIDPSQTFSLPECELGNLGDIENVMRMANNSAAGRDALTKFIIANDYVAKLVPLVEVAEDFESLADLNRLCNIVKSIILLNDNAIIEQVVRDDNMMGVLGALEYDPEFPGLKANHRRYLSDPSRFKEVVKIDDPNVRQKIHYTFRLHYLKDVVLARILDDPTFSVLNSLIFFNQIEIIQHIHTNMPFLQELFSIVLKPEVDSRRKKDAVAFLQQCCSIAKGLQLNIRGALYNNFLSAGLFKVITFALKQPDTSIRVAGTDILIALIEHDPVMMRSHIFRSINEKGTPLTDNLIEMLLVEPDLGVKCQMADALKVLLDPIANAQTVESITRGNGEYTRRPAHQVSSSADQFVQHFYEESCRKVFAPLRELDKRPSMTNLTTAEGQLFTQLIEILCFFIRNHSYRTKSFLASEGIPFKIGRLFQCPEKHLKLLGLKYFRSTLNLHDPFHYSMMIQYNIVEPIIDILLETMPKDNLLNSVCLDFFDTIRRQENNKDLITYLATKLRDKLEKLTYMETFRQLLQKYEAMTTAPPPDELSSFTTVETEQTPNANINRPTGGMNGQSWQGLKEADPEEENYFNGSDGEEDDEWLRSWDTQKAQALRPQKKEVLGTLKSQSQSEKPLVAYGDDDEDEDELALDLDEEEVLYVNGTTGIKEPANMTSNAEAKALTPEPSPEREPPVSEPAGSTTSTTAIIKGTKTPSKEDKEPALERDETPSPPERIIEKRKRAAVEEDEEDELSKLSSQPKRRSSIGSGLAAGGNTTAVTTVSGPMASVGQRTRKRTLSSSATHPVSGSANKENHKGSGAVKKITISLASKPEEGGKEENEGIGMATRNGEKLREREREKRKVVE